MSVVIRAVFADGRYAGAESSNLLATTGADQGVVRGKPVMRQIQFTCDECRGVTTEPKGWFVFIPPSPGSSENNAILRPLNSTEVHGQHLCSIGCLLALVKQHAERIIADLVVNKCTGKEERVTNTGPAFSPSEFAPAILARLAKAQENKQTQGKGLHFESYPQTTWKVEAQ